MSPFPESQIMPNWSYTYVPSEDPNALHIQQRRAQLGTMNREQSIAYLRQMAVEVDEVMHRFRRLLAPPVYRDMLANGEYWKSFRQQSRNDVSTIQKLSSLNLLRLVNELRRVNMNLVMPLLQRLENLPYTLKHNTKKPYVENITKTRTILSLTEIHRRGLGDTLKGGTDHEGADQVNIHNEDFVFFRLALGYFPAHSRFGTECFVFKPDQLFKFGWVSLHDMLSPASTERYACFPNISKIQDIGNVKPSPFNMPARTLANEPQGMCYSYPLNGRKTVRLHRAQVVFYGDDIRRGIACAVVNELNLMFGVKGLQMALDVCGPGEANDKLLLNLIGNLFFLEAKVPTKFQFAPHELLAFHTDVAYDKSSKM
jgi:hypothetical protein